MNSLLAIQWFVPTSMIETMGWVLMHTLWQYLLVALIAGILARVLKKTSSSTRYLVLVLAFGLAIASPVVTWFVLKGEVLPVHATEAPVANQVFPATSVSLNSPDGFEGEQREPITGNPTDIAEEWIPQKSQSFEEPSITFVEQMKTTLKPWLGWIVGFWMAGVFFGSFRPLLGWWTLWRLRRIGVSPVSREIEVAARRISTQLGLRSIVQVFQSSLASVPVVVGYLRPMVLFPVSLLAELPVTQLEAILAHELAHIRRHDFVVNLLQAFVETLFFYHPAIWWLSHQIRIEREYCCDDLVIRLFDNRVDYGRALVAIEQKRGQSALLALGANDGSMLSRVKRILGHGSQGASRPSGSYPTTWSYLGGFLAALSMLVFLNLFSLNGNAETRAGEFGQEAAASQNLPGESPLLPGGSPPLPGGPILTKEIRLDLKLDPGKDKGWFFINLDDGKIRKPDFPVEFTLKGFPKLEPKPDDLRFKNWLIENRISLILSVERALFEDGSGKNIQYQVVTQSFRSILIRMVPPRVGDKERWTDQPKWIINPFRRMDEATLFADSSGSAGEIKPDSPHLSLFRTCANTLGFYLLERNDFKQESLNLKIVRVANVSQPLQDLDFDGTFVPGKDGAPDPSGLDKPIRGNLQPPWVVASKTGSWLLSSGATLKISSQSVPSADELIVARITWPGEGNNPDPKKTRTIAADAFGNRVKWAIGYEKDQPFLWVATLEVGKNLLLKKLRIEKGNEKLIDEIIRKTGEPIDGLGIPDQIAREMEKVLGWTAPAKSEVVKPNDLAPGMVRVMGRIVDAETGAPINLIAIQGGTASEKDPAKMTWGHGFWYGVTLEDGKFDQVLNWAHHERRRILAPGYEPASILVELPNPLPANQVVERTIRLKKGRMVKGVLKDHEGKPVAKGKVFFIPETHRANILRGIPGLEGLRGGISQNLSMDYSVSQAVTDSSGGFEIRSGGNGILAASTESVDLWPFPLPETDRVPDLILPQPGQLKIDLSYGYLDELAKKGKEVISPDSESPNQWYLTLYRLDQNDPLWKKCQYSGMLAVFLRNQPGAISKGVKIGEIKESTKTGSFEINSATWVNKTLATSITVDLPPGVYQLFRHRPGERSPQQETFEIKPGGSARLDWTRAEGAAIFGSAALPPKSQFVRQPGEAPVPLTWSIPHGHILIATREGKTMEVAKIHNDGCFFIPRHLPPGKYKAIAWAWLPESDQSRQFNLYPFVPGLTGEKEFEIPAVPEGNDGTKREPKRGLPPVRLDLTMESRTNQIVSGPVGNPAVDKGPSLVNPRPFNDQEIEKRVLAILRKPYVPDPDKGSWQGGAFEAEILMNLTGIQPRDLVVKTLLKVIDGTEASSQDQRRLALLHLSGAIPTELVPRLIQSLKLWETKPFNPRDRIGPRLEIEMLGRMGQDATEAIPVLIKLLDLPDWNVRGDAIQALVKIGPRSPLVIQAIFERLDDAETVYQAARFGELGKPHAAKLVPLLESKRAGIRTWAAWGLVTTGYNRDRGLEFLVKQVATGSSEEKKLAATALAALGSQSRPVLEKLRMLEKGTPPDVVKEIKEAVARIEKDDRILTHAQEADKVVASRIASREAVKRIQETTPQPLIGKGTIEQINNSGFLLAEGLILTTNDTTTYFHKVEGKEVPIPRKEVKVGAAIQWEGVPGKAVTKIIVLPVKSSLPRGLEFLEPYPRLHELSLSMTEGQFLEIAKNQKLKLRKIVTNGKNKYYHSLGDGHTVIVMFAGVGEKCSGIQRIRGEESDPPAPEEKPGTSPPSVSRDNPLERKISGNLRNLSLQEGLNTIAKTANVTLQLDQAGLKETGLDLKKSISVDFAYVPLSTALGRVINWEKHPGLMYEMRGNKLVIMTLAEYQKHIESHLPDWLKVHYNKGLLAKLDGDHQVISITTSGIVTDELLAKFASLPRLKDLYIEATRQISPAGLKHLAKMGSLEALALHDLQYEEKGLGDIIIPQLIGLKTLRELTMANCGLTDTGARSLENLTQLTLLSLTNQGKLTDEALASISQLKKLKSLNLSSSANLTRQISPLTEAGLNKLTVLEGLEELHLVGHPVTGEVLKFPKLKSLSLGFSSVGDDCAQRIATFQDLRSLQLQFTGITDNGLKQIAGLPCLIQLNLDSSVITDQGIESLRKSKTLSHLSLRASQLTDRSLGYVAQIPSLTRIDLNGSGEPGFHPGHCFTKAGVEQLKALPDLRTLWLTNFQSPGGYMGLKDFTQLHELTFLMADIRQTDVEALEEALPNTRIHAATGGGFVSPRIKGKKNPK